PLEHGRFCGECGAPVANQAQQLQDRQRGGSLVSSFADSFKRTQPVMHTHEMPHVAPPEEHASKKQQAPKFAQVGATQKRDIPPEVRAEFTKLLCLLARERLFLIMHCLIFVTLNLTGLSLSLHAYNGFIGDDMTRSVMALTPLFFINTVALACLAPIKGTKREIARIKERIKFVRIQIEYRNLF
ncbi:MAG: hypothetical protein ACRD3W_04155, partial [Terriglobales bacterium]